MPEEGFTGFADWRETYLELPTSVTSKKSPNVYKSFPKMIFLEKFKLPKNVGDLGKLIVAKVAQRPINSPIWSHCYQRRSAMTK